MIASLLLNNACLVNVLRKTKYIYSSVAEQKDGVWKNGLNHDQEAIDSIDSRSGMGSRRADKFSKHEVTASRNYPSHQYVLRRCYRKMDDVRTSAPTSSRKYRWNQYVEQTVTVCKIRLASSRNKPWHPYFWKMCYTDNYRVNMGHHWSVQTMWLRQCLRIWKGSHTSLHAHTISNRYVTDALPHSLLFWCQTWCRDTQIAPMLSLIHQSFSQWRIIAFFDTHFLGRPSAIRAGWPQKKVSKKLMTNMTNHHFLCQMTRPSRINWHLLGTAGASAL